MIELPDESPEAILAEFESRGWGDGLPLIAPTAERVDLMLGGADPDEVVAVLAPRDGRADRRAIAVNAVLAGCRPDTMAVLVAAVRALAQPQINLRGVNATTHPVAPLLIVHGAVVDQVGFNGGLGAFGPGNRANATVGRALRFVLLHIAGAVPGAGDASTQGQPSKYTYCVAENEPASPWGSYAASVGVDAPSAVTVHCGENPHNFHDMESASAERILGKASSLMTTFGANNACIATGEFFVGLCPEHARTIADAGFDRGDVAQWLFDHARRPAGEYRAHFDLRVWTDEMNAAADDDLIPPTGQVDNIKVLVVGGAGKHSCVIPSWGMTTSVTMALDT
ncbi:MAG: hypothetical protein OEW42_09835 [Acidimicrobiia bacterium]|nr:hypothetical protein [Acidimicrobiia bacterium]MDH5238053.1 hypothetical protein [Acidimicrobiia bacterium]